MYFYFEAQTGCIYPKVPRTRSNYYRYTFDKKHLARVEEIVASASLGSAGLEYKPEDLRWLRDNEIDRPGCAWPRPRNPNFE